MALVSRKGNVIFTPDLPLSLVHRLNVDFNLCGIPLNNTLFAQVTPKCNLI